jgi:hypothetical protein
MLEQDDVKVKLNNSFMTNILDKKNNLIISNNDEMTKNVQVTCVF